MLFLIAMLAAGRQATAQDETDFPLDHKTLYLATAVAGGHRFEISGMISGGSGAGMLLVDPNKCQLDEFGNRGACTLIAAVPINVRFRQLRLADPCKAGREIYAIEGELPQDTHMWLVIGRMEQPNVLRLVVQHEQVRSAFPLVPKKECDEAGGGNPEPADSAAAKSPDDPAPKPDPATKTDCEGELGEATYSALFSKGAVHVIAVGEHPTAGYDQCLHQKPIRIFPPQFEFRVQPPDGFAAQVITPFIATASFTAAEAPQAVIVHDANGMHEVEVVQSK